jgi:hypothetical protein
VTFTLDPGPAPANRRRRTGVLSLIAAGAITAASFAGIASAGAGPQQPSGPAVVVEGSAVNDTSEPDSSTPDQSRAKKDVLKKSLDLSSQPHDSVNPLGR